MNAKARIRDKIDKQEKADKTVDQQLDFLRCCIGDLLEAITDEEVLAVLESSPAVWNDKKELRIPCPVCGGNETSLVEHDGTINWYKCDVCDREFAQVALPCKAST